MHQNLPILYTAHTLVIKMKSNGQMDMVKKWFLCKVDVLSTPVSRIMLMANHILFMLVIMYFLLFGSGLSDRPSTTHLLVGLRD